MADTNQSERAAFEAWIQTTPGHPYAGQFTTLMWKAWQAARSQAVPAGQQEVTAIEAFRALLRAEVDSSIDVSCDIAWQEAQIDEADHLLVKFNELFPEGS